MLKPIIIDQTRTPQTEQERALNLDTGPQNDEPQVKLNIFQQANNSKYIYPGIAIIVASILVIVVLFQRVTLNIKIFIVVLLLIFVVFTIHMFRNQS